jgi:hypothetical protein
VSDDSSRAGSRLLTFHDYLGPGLEAGTYTVTADHHVDVPKAVIPSASHTFHVAGPRFVLDPTDIHAVYPPVEATGPYAETLAQVTFTTRTLAWERRLGLTEERRSPWLALLVLDAFDLPSSGSPLGTVPMRTGALVPVPADPHIRAPRLMDPVADPDQLCQVLELPASLLAPLLPRPGDLPYLAHVRALDGAGPEPDSGWYAQVIANRLPSSSPLGVRNVAHLVSLEGHEDLLADPPTESTTTVRLVSLLAWAFTATPVTDEEGHSFRALATGLATVRDDDRADRALGLAYSTDAAEATSDSAARRVARRLRDGYLPVDHVLPTGETSVAWYRGPLIPEPTDLASGAATAHVASSAAALAYEPETGVFDVSRATAWELGRALALADRSFAVTLVRVRRSAHRLVDTLVGSLQSRHLDTADDLAAVARDGLIEQRFLDYLRVDLVGDVARLARKATADTTGRSGSAGPPTTQGDPASDPIAAVRKLLDREDVRAVVAAAVADDLVPITAWLRQLTLLQGMPFPYLVAHPRVLPPESWRRAVLDPGWIRAMIDGALSLGLAGGSSRDSWFQGILHTLLDDLADEIRPGSADRTTAILVRSALITGWPGLVVEAEHDGTPLPLLRRDLLSPGLLLCLVDGSPTTVRLRAPDHGVHLGLVDGSVIPRHIQGPDIGLPVGQPVPIAADEALWRPGGRQVLNLVAPENAGTGSAEPDLVGRLGAVLGARPGPAELALQLLQTPDELVLSVR